MFKQCGRGVAGFCQILGLALGLMMIWPEVTKTRRLARHDYSLEWRREQHWYAKGKNESRNNGRQLEKLEAFCERITDS